MPKRISFPSVVVAPVLALASVALAVTGAPVKTEAEPASGEITLDSVLPARQSVHGHIELRGSGFGAYEPGTSEVTFTAGATSITGGTPYVWRDDYIRIRVPVGDYIDDAIVLIPKTPLDVTVTGVSGTSGSRPFRVITSSGKLAFVERTEINEKHLDLSTFLGDPPRNLARTKDAEIGDANGDGYPDLIDNNSNNRLNFTHPVLRTNNGGTGFSSMDMEPINDEDKGVFATVVPEGGRYLGDGVIYDSDLVDLNNDGLPDLVQAAARSPLGHKVRVLMNNHLNVPGRFIEDSEAWMGEGDLGGCPDDVAHADANNDGWVDVSIAIRTAHGDCGGPNGTGAAMVFLNQAGVSFSEPVMLLSPNTISSHDSIFLDANDDGYNDVFIVNEEGSVCQLYLNDGGTIPSFTMSETLDYIGFSGEEGDFNGDGLPDLVIGRINVTSAFLNNPEEPGTFTEVVLTDAQFGMYDYEIGDLNLDGFPDIVGCAIISDGRKAIQIWLSDGDGTFTNITAPNARNVLPSLGDYQRLSAEMIDFDLDGDLDLYVTGADGQSVGYGFGKVPNQFYESLLATVCVGDVDGSGTVGFDDLLLVLSNWGPCEDCPADVDGNDEVNFDDLLLVLSGWGPCE